MDDYQVSERGLVSTIHVLKSGEIISSVHDYMKVEDRFSWVDRTYIVSKILELQKKTDERKRSFIVIYEDGNLIREFVNVDQGFKPLNYYK
ncbi:MAG: hypothetical protein C5B59_08965 [Bacteroidetes bacterium]|nr:MAG: hypothetical protein C5B59_08965 [Bacteroidota bacterium]